jgi:alcohol dehydrogenase
MHLVYKYLPTVYCDQSNKQAREKMAYAEFLGGMAFNSASLGFIHSLSHALSGMFDVPHGLANAVIMPYVLDYEINRKNVAHQLGKIADFMGIDVLANDEFNKAKETIQKIANFLKNLGIPHTLSELQLQITKKQIRKMSLHAMKDFCGISNPVQFSRREVKHIYQNAINGSFENI